MVCGRPAGTGRRFRRCRHRAPMCRLGGAPERRRWRLRAPACVGFGGGGGGVEPGVAGVHVLPVEEDGGEGAAGEDGQRLPAVVGGGERDEQDALGDAEVDPLHEGAGAGGLLQLGGLRAGAGRGDDLVHDACRDEERDAAAAGGQTLDGHRLPLVFGEPRLVERLVVTGVVGLVVGGLVASQRGCGFGGGLRGGDVGGLLRVGLWPDAGCAGVEGPVRVRAVGGLAGAACNSGAAVGNRAAKCPCTWLSVRPAGVAVGVLAGVAPNVWPSTPPGPKSCATVSKSLSAVSNALVPVVSVLVTPLPVSMLLPEPRLGMVVWPRAACSSWP